MCTIKIAGHTNVDQTSEGPSLSSLNKLHFLYFHSSSWVEVRLTQIFSIVPSNSRYRESTVLWLEDGNLYLRLQTMTHTIYPAKFEQTIIHQQVHLQWESQSHEPVSWYFEPHGKLNPGSIYLWYFDPRFNFPYGIVTPGSIFCHCILNPLMVNWTPPHFYQKRSS